MRRPALALLAPLLLFGLACADKPATTPPVDPNPVGTTTDDSSPPPSDASGPVTDVKVSVERDPAWAHTHPIEVDPAELREFVIASAYLLNADFTNVADAVVEAFATLDADQCVRLDVEGQGVARIYAEDGKVILAAEDGLEGRSAAMGIRATATVK